MTHRRVIAAGNQGSCRTFPSMAQYRVYELDSSDHIAAGYSVECGSDATAMHAAGRLLERAAGVEVWEPVRCVGHLSATAPWDRLRSRWTANSATPASLQRRGWRRLWCDDL